MYTMKKFLRLQSLCLAFILLFLFASPAFAEDAAAPTPKGKILEEGGTFHESSTVTAAGLGMTSRGIALMDAATGTYILVGNGDQKMPMASTTKMMTALLFMESLNSEADLQKTHVIGNEVYVDEWDSSMAGFAKGKTVTYEDLLYGLMLPSGNDAAQIIGVVVSGSVEAFVEKMNTRAKELGMENTHFANPHGLHHSSHYTTPEDMAILAREYLKNETLKKVCSTQEYHIKTGMPTSEGRTVYNSNPLLGEVDGVNGLKTGFTDQAGSCLVSSCERDGRTIICVVLGSKDKNIRNNETKKLLEYAYRTTELVNLYDITGFQVLTVENVPQSWEDKPIEAYVDYDATVTPIFMVTNEKRALLMQEGSYKVTFNPKEGLAAPINVGDVIGTATITLDGVNVAEYEVISEEKVINRQHVITFFICVGSLVVLILAIIVRLIHRHSEKKEKRRMAYEAQRARQAMMHQQHQGRRRTYHD